MNTVTLSGRIVREIELRYIQASNTAFARFTIAVDKDLSKDKKQEFEASGKATADFINCVSYGKQAETIAKYSGKGLRILIGGRIQTGSYQDNKGNTVYTTEVLVNQTQFIDFKAQNSNSNSQNRNSGKTQQGFQDVTNNDFQYDADFDPTQDDRIPF